MFIEDLIDLGKSILIFVILFIVVSVILYLPFYWSSTGNFECVSIDGETFKSNYCYTSKGTMFAHKEDGTKIIIKSYKRIGE